MQEDIERACNDDRAQGNLLSLASVPLAANQLVYVFVDSYEGVSTGAYTLAAHR